MHKFTKENLYHVYGAQRVSHGHVLIPRFPHSNTVFFGHFFQEMFRIEMIQKQEVI